MHRWYRPWGDRHLGRADLEALLDEITTDGDTAVRVQVYEADGSGFADIATPPEPSEPRIADPAPESRRPALAGAGFEPGEEVALAYVVARQLADSEGSAAIFLPPALLAATRGGLVMLGLTSQKVAPVEAPA